MKIKKKTLFAVVIGNGLEYYDVMLFGFFAIILAPLFFPNDNPTVSFIASMGSYGAGFIMRPIGGIVFGHLGDRWGRKNTLSLSIFLISIPTLIIAFLPTYEQIGIMAPIILVLSRLFQGFCLGGESSGAMTYLIEHSKPSKKDMASAILVVSCYAGTLVGTTLGAIFTLPFMPSWGWRLTFVVGSLIAFVGYYVRRKLTESPEFVELQRNEGVLKLPIRDIFRYDKKNLLCAACTAACIAIPFFITFILLNSFYMKTLRLTSSQVLTLNALLMVFWVTCLPVFGYLAQRYGRCQIMQLGAIGMIVTAYPLFMLLEHQITLGRLLFTQVIISLLAMAYAAPSSAFLTTLFSTDKRYSGIAVGFSLGHAIIGGFTPIILTTLVGTYHFQMAPALFLIFGASLGWIAVYTRGYLKEKTKVPDCSLMGKPPLV